MNPHQLKVLRKSKGERFFAFEQPAFDYLVQLKHQEQYNAWVLLDPQMQKTYHGTDGKPGFTLNRESKNKKDVKASQRIVSLLHRTK